MELLDNANTTENYGYNNIVNNNDKKNKEYYAVAVGRSTGVFNDWGEANASTSGCPHNLHKKFNTYKEAETWMHKKGASNPSRKKTYKTQADFREDNNQYLRHQQLKPTETATLKQTNRKDSNLTDYDNYDEELPNTTSSITLSTIKSECPQKHIKTLELLIESGASMESLKNLVTDWSNSANTPNEKMKPCH